MSEQTPEFITGTLKGIITIERDYFELLLNCLANQKFINQINVDALSTDTDYRQVEHDCQMAIDKAWLTGMDILHRYDHENLSL